MYNKHECHGRNNITRYNLLGKPSSDSILAEVHTLSYETVKYVNLENLWVTVQVLWFQKTIVFLHFCSTYKYMYNWAMHNEY